MQIAYMPFGVTRPLLDEFCRTHSTKHASEKVYTKSLAERRLSNEREDKAGEREK